MDKQEAAFTLWANTVLQPDEEHVLSAKALSSRRLGARVKGLLWKLYSEDEGVISVMLRIEQRISEGLMRTKNEVWHSSSGSGPQVTIKALGSSYLSLLSLEPHVRT